MNDPSEIDQSLLDLLVEWEELKSAGTAVAPEDLCRDCPERVDDLRRLIEKIAELDTLLNLSGDNSPPALPGFELLEEIGRGGMGVVYKARDTNLDRMVAIKIPFSATSGLVLRKRFEREGRTLAKLRHTNIVSIHTAGLAGNTPYFVMEHIQGGNLAERMNEMVENLYRTAAMISQVARTVDYAHSIGFVHRDLKPSNILLNELGQPFVSDFGVAALLSGEPLIAGSGETPSDRKAGHTQFTHSGAAVGTPAYASPESWKNEPRQLSAAADVWSLGVILYECLTGRLPYLDLENDQEGNRLPPTRPRSIRPKIPPGLETIAMRCLVIDPAGRYPTAAAMSQDLDRWLRRVRFYKSLKAGMLAALFATVAIALAVALAWPKSPLAQHADVTRELISEFAKAGRLELIPPTGKPRAHLLRVNQSIARTGLSEDGFFYAESPRPCLVELLPDVNCNRYRITAELRQMTGLFNAEVGVYCGHSNPSPDGQFPGHRFVFLTLADTGLLAHKYQGPDGRMGSGLNLRGFRYAPLTRRKVSGNKPFFGGNGTSRPQWAPMRQGHGVE